MTSFNHQTFLVSDEYLIKTVPISCLDCRQGAHDDFFCRQPLRESLVLTLSFKLSPRKYSYGVESDEGSYHEGLLI